MQKINWGSRPPTKKEQDLYKKWKRYLQDSRLSDHEIDRRAKVAAEAHRQVPKD